MSSERLPPLVDIALRGSRSLAVLGAAAYLAAIVAVWFSGLSWLACLPLMTVLFAFGAWWIVVHGLRLAAFSIRRIVWQPEGECILVDRRGRTSSGSIQSGVFVSHFLAAVCVRVGRRTRTVVIARDAVDADTFRRLRMRLNISPPAAHPSFLRRRLDFLRAHARREKA
ncbi:MAG: protein YgfX [Gammaproteobacteria bacterium]